jgi:hypothetical protein
VLGDIPPGLGQAVVELDRSHVVLSRTCPPSRSWGYDQASRMNGVPSSTTAT